MYTKYIEQYTSAISHQRVPRPFLYDELNVTRLHRNMYAKNATKRKRNAGYLKLPCFSCVQIEV